jgi:hypothetical protein
MKIVFATSSTDSDFNSDCDYAYVNLTPALARYILGLMDAAVRLYHSNNAIHELHCWECSACFFGMELDDLRDKLEKHLPGSSDSYSLLPARITIPESHFRRTEYDHLVVTVSGVEPEVYWRAIPRDSGVYVETGMLPRRLVERIAAGKRVKPGKY